MKWALFNNERIIARPGIKGVCPLCNENVIPKCGTIKVWHWSHLKDTECDSWGEGETEWHLSWKNEFPKEQQEVIIKPHRADIKTQNGVIIELQNSPISPENILERERFYKNMIWLINGKKFAIGLNLRKKDKIYTFRWKNPPKSWWLAKSLVYIDLSYKINELKKELYSFENGIKIIKPIKQKEYNEYTGETYWNTNSYVDVTSETIIKMKQEIVELERHPIFLIKKIYNKIPCGGWGILLSKKELLIKLRGNNGTANN